MSNPGTETEVEKQQPPVAEDFLNQTEETPAEDQGHEDYSEDHSGQLELNDIDTELGRRAEDYLKADAQLIKAKKAVQEKQTSVIEEMKNLNIRTLRFKGYTIRFTPGHVTPDKLSYRANES